MTDHRHDAPDLRLDVPTLEPDDVFVHRLATLAALSAPPRPAAVARSAARGGWRVTVAAAGVAGVIGGGAWLAAAVTGVHSPNPPTPPATHPHRGDDAPTSPAGHQTPQLPEASSGTDDSTSGEPTDGGAAPTGEATPDDDGHRPGAAGAAHGHAQGHPGDHGAPGGNQQAGATPGQGHGAHHGDHSPGASEEGTDAPDGDTVGDGDSTGNEDGDQDTSDDQPAGG